MHYLFLCSHKHYEVCIIIALVSHIGEWEQAQNSIKQRSSGSDSSATDHRTHPSSGVLNLGSELYHTNVRHPPDENGIESRRVVPSKH